MIDTETYSGQLRARGADPGRQALLISDLRGSSQEDDLSEPVNCGGYGRIRHFGAVTSPGWRYDGMILCNALGAELRVVPKTA